LDYGCGYGDLTQAIAETHEVVGCDVDPARVAFARHEYPALEFQTCDASCTPFGEQTFDIVVSSVVIHFVPDPRAYLAEARRLLRPDGYLLIVFRNEAVVRNTLRRCIGKGKSATWLWIASMSDARRLLEDLGFRIICATYFYDPPFASWRNLGDYLVGSIEQVCSMMCIKGPAGYHAFLAKVVDR
jgi:ubiquinone/menaquinone biosynthesis C-methylase UbiE